MEFKKIAEILLFVMFLLTILFAITTFASAGSGYFQLNQLPNAPNNPLCDGQVNPTKITTITPTFSWTFSDPDTGELGDGTQGGFNIIVGIAENDDSLWNYATSSSTQSVVYAGSALSRGVTYHWKVRTNDTYESTMGGFCGDQIFKINSLPVATVEAPTNGSTGQSLTPILVWSFFDSDGDSQTAYHVQVDDDQNFGSPVVNQNTTSSNTYYMVVTPLSNNTNYYWRISLKDGDEWSGWQGWWTFKTTNISVGEIKTYNSTYMPKISFVPNQLVVIRYNVTNIENMNNTFITIKDPLGIKRVDNASVASVQDTFQNENNWDQDYPNRWNINNNRYQHGANGGSSQYGAWALIKESVFENQTNLSMQCDVMIDFSNEDMERLIFRWNDSRNYSSAFISETYSTVGIEEWIDGVRYKEETSRLFSEDTWYTLKVSVVGNSATVYVNGLEMVTKTLSRNVPGRMGLGCDTGWIYFDNFSIGYNNSRVVGPITNGWQYEFNYTIPNNESIAGIWEVIAYAQSGGETATNSTTFDVLAEAPLIKNITFYNESYVEKDMFTSGQIVRIRAWVSDSDGGSALTECNITVKNPQGTTKVSEEDMVDIGDITNGNIYEYNYTIPHELESQGIWNITIKVHDNKSNHIVAYDTFENDIHAPNVTAIITYDGLSVKKSVFALNELVKIRATVTDEDGRDNISQCNVTIRAPNGTSVVTTATMTDIGNVSNGNIYEYEYLFPLNQDDYGTWEIFIQTNDTYYSDSAISHMVLVWANTSYYHRTPIVLTERFGISRINEQKGFNISLPSYVCGGNDTIRMLNEKGEEVPIKIQRRSNSDYWINYVVNISADDSLTYYLYYNMTGSAGSYYNTYDDVQKRTLSESNYTLLYNASGTNITYGKSIAVGDIDNDTVPEIVVVGRTGAEGKHYTFVKIFNATFSDNDTAVTACEASKEYNLSGQSGSMSFGYSVKLNDIDNDGQTEIIVGGTAYDGTRNMAQLVIFNYTDGVLTEEANKTWYDDTAGETSIFGVFCYDVDGDGVTEILTAGTTGTHNSRGQFAVHNYTGGTIKHEYFHNISLTQSSPNNWTEFYAISVGNLYNIGVVPQVVVAGEGKDSSGVINAVFIVMRWTGSTWNQDYIKNWYNGQLSEIFSCAIGDVDNRDNDNEIFVSGNYFDGTRDVAMYRVYYSDGPTYPSTLKEDTNASKDWYVYGYSSALTALLDDYDYDNTTEIITVGFQNDGTMDRGDYKIRLYNGSATIDEYSQLWVRDKARRSGDFYDACVLYDLNNDGFKELIDTGRYDLTPPTGTFIRIQSIDGISQDIQAEELLPPHPPTNSSSVASGRTSSAINLTWMKASDANNTVIVYKKNSAPANRFDGTVCYNGTGNSTTVSGLDAGTHYYFRLWSWRNGSSSYSEQFDEMDEWTNPGAPVIIAGSPTSSSIHIDITKGENASHTCIVRNESGYGNYPNSRSNGTTIYNGTGSETTDSGLEHVTTYYYSAWAFDENSGYWSDYYSTDYTITNAKAPSIQTNTSTEIEETSAILWGFVNDDGGNDVSVGFYYDTISSGTANNVTVTGTHVTYDEFSKLIESLTKGEQYHFRAWGYNTGGFAVAGNELKLLTKPDAPTNLEGILLYNSVILNWDEANCGFGETIGTRIQYRTDSYPTSVDDGNNAYNGTTESAEVDVSSDTHYFFSAWSWVRSENNDDFKWSDTYVTFDIWSYPSPPSDFSAVEVSDTKVNLTWIPSSGDTTLILRNESGWGQYPNAVTNGTVIYNGSGSSYDDTGLKSGVTYYYSAWSWNETRGVYSIAYVSDEATTLIFEANISVSPNTYDFGDVLVGDIAFSTNYTFNITNNGLSAMVTISVSNSENWTFANYSDRGHKKFCMNFSKTNWSDETSIVVGGSEFVDNIDYLQSILFDLKVLTPTSIDKIGDRELWVVTFTSTPN